MESKSDVESIYAYKSEQSERQMAMTWHQLVLHRSTQFDCFSTSTYAGHIWSITA